MKTSCYILCAFFLAAHGLGQISESGLVGWYPLDGSGLDLSSQANNLILNNVTTAADKNGTAGGALYFNGTTSWMVSTNNVPISGSNPRTLSVWIKSDELSFYKGNPVILGLGTKSGTNALYDLTFFSNNGSGQSWSSATGAYIWNHTSNGGFAGSTASRVITSSQWFHIAMTSDGTRSGSKLYINGAEQPIFGDAGTWATVLGKLRVSTGSQNSGPVNDSSTWWNQGFKGYMDDIRIYSRALSASEVAILYSSGTSLNSAPMIAAQPIATMTTNAGSQIALSVSAYGKEPIYYQWYKSGNAISGANDSNYVISSTKTTDTGSYSVVVSNSIGSVTSTASTLTVTAPRLSNLSVRTALDANQIVIVGVTMSGGAKNVLLRAVGPTLSAFGVPSVMADPKLDLYSGSTKLTSNDNWGGAQILSAAFQSVGAFAYTSNTSLDAAVVTLIEGGRTVQVSGPTSGTVLVEGYDAGSGDTQRFTNLSARNKVGTGANILIAGFTLTGSGTRNLLIRAVGPKLSDFGVTGVLTDPKLEIYSGSTKLTENDNWSSSLATTFSSVGAFGLTTGSKDAAITVSLPAGGYTVQVSGADGGVGEAIVEIYELP